MRINALREFGTPEEVAQRDMNSNEERDSIANVALVGMSLEDPESKSYDVSCMLEG